MLWITQPRGRAHDVADFELDTTSGVDFMREDASEMVQLTADQAKKKKKRNEFMWRWPIRADTSRAVLTAHARVTRLETAAG